METARSSLNRSNHSETEQTNDLPRDEVTESQNKEILDKDPEKNLKIKLNVDVDENTEISVDTCEILEQSDRGVMALVS